MSAYTLTDFGAGDEIRAFHPLTLGVVHTADVVTVGRKHLTVTFPLFGTRTHRIPAAHVTEIVTKASLRNG